VDDAEPYPRTEEVGYEPVGVADSQVPDGGEHHGEQGLHHNRFHFFSFLFFFAHSAENGAPDDAIEKRCAGGSHAKGGDA